MIASPELTLATAQAWLQQGRPATLVRIGATRGSVPRESGCCMLVDAQTTAGTIGGGHLELQAIARARDLLDTPGVQALAPWPVSLGPSLGQCCGGALTLHIERLSPASLEAWPSHGLRFRLHLWGAGHVGRAVAHACATLPCSLLWWDERADMFPPGPLPAHIQTQISDDLVAEVGQAQAGDHHLVLTHSHALDLELVHALLRRGDAGWLGLIGSATKRARFEHRLAERGVSAAALGRLVCPVGLPGISGKEPGVIATAVVAQLLQGA